MRPRHILTVVIVAALVGAWWLYSQRPETKASIASAPMAGSNAHAGEAGALSPSAVLSIKVGKASTLPKAAQPSASAMPTLMREFDTARNLKALYDRLSGPGAPSTPDAKFVLFKILATCGKRVDKLDPALAKKAAPIRRKALADSISDANPDKARRLAAFDALAARCEGVEDASVTGAELNALLDDAARGGDPTARATQVQRDIFGPDGTMNAQTHITEAQMGTLREALASRDPDAVQRAGMILSNTFPNMVLEVGPGHDELEGRASLEAWNLLACEYGLECGASSSRIANECANQGRCGAASVPDLIFYYGVSPNEAQLIDQYRQAFRQAVESNDWSQLQPQWRPNTSTHHYGFVSYP